MNEQILNQLDLIETQLVEIYNSIGMEMGNHYLNQDGDEYKTLYEQKITVKGLLHTVRNTLREAAPELYPDL